jgi:hypothetical protein
MLPTTDQELGMEASVGLDPFGMSLRKSFALHHKTGSLGRRTWLHHVWAVLLMLPLLAACSSSASRSPTPTPPSGCKLAGKIVEFPLPTANSRPSGITVGPQQQSLVY